MTGSLEAQARLFIAANQSTFSRLGSSAVAFCPFTGQMMTAPTIEALELGAKGYHRELVWCVDARVLVDPSMGVGERAHGGSI